MTRSFQALSVMMLMARSKRIRGARPKIVAFLMMTGLKVVDFNSPRTFSIATLLLA